MSHEQPELRIEQIQGQVHAAVTGIRNTLKKYDPTVRTVALRQMLIDEDIRAMAEIQQRAEKPRREVAPLAQPREARTSADENPLHSRLRILRIKEVQHLTGLSRTSIYRKMEAKEFPAPVRLGVQSVGWRSSDIEQWTDIPWGK
jgi:prophage regulatory protein